MLRDKKFVRFLLVFGAVFAACYFGALFFTGLAVPDSHYSPFVKKYFDIAGWMRDALIATSKWLLHISGTETVRVDEYVLRAVNGRGIRLVYSCLGFGVMSFWAAYVAAGDGRIVHKLGWLFTGLATIYIINVIRISLVLKAANSGSVFPFGWDHHSWFNITAYIVLLLLIFLHYRLTEKNNKIRLHAD